MGLSQCIRPNVASCLLACHSFIAKLPQTLVELKRRCTHGLRQRLDAFDHVIYTQAGGSWDGESLYQAVIHEPPPATVKPTKSSMHGLEPMYKA